MTIKDRFAKIINHRPEVGSLDALEALYNDLLDEALGLEGLATMNSDIAAAAIKYVAALRGFNACEKDKEPAKLLSVKQAELKLCRVVEGKS